MATQRNSRMAGPTTPIASRLPAFVFVLCALGFTCRSRVVESTPPPSLERTVRPAAHAGSWYPGGEEELRHDLARRLGKRRARPAEPIVALVAPHAGLRWSGDVAAAAYAELSAQRVERVFLLGPSHRTAYTGVALPGENLDGYDTPLGELRIDHTAVAALRGKPGFDGPARAHLPEHSLEMHAIFVAATHPQASLVPLVVGHIGDVATTRQIAAAIRPLLRAGDVVLVSSDFTHYGAGFGYVPFRDDVPQRLNAAMDRALDHMRRRDLQGFSSYLGSTGDTICGRSAIEVLLALLPADAIAEEIDRDTSGHLTGDYSSSVSYLSVAWRRSGGWPATGDRQGSRQGRIVLDDNEKRLALTMARKTLRSYLIDGETPDEDDLNVPRTGVFRDTRSVFVTLKKHGQLRGCIGHILPTQPLWLDIRDNAISAAVRDTRFPPVTAAELEDLHLEISVLTPPQPIAGPDQFEVGRHGVILTARGRRAVFLPQVAPEQGWDRATALSHLARKAGLPENTWQTDDAAFQVFEAQVFAEPG